MGLQRENRRKRRKKLGRGEGEWQKEIQRQGGKCRGEETDGMDRTKRRSGTNKGTYIGSREDHLEIALRKGRGGKEQRRKEVGDRNKIVNFFGISMYIFI
jgi:hypothetical protein